MPYDPYRHHRQSLRLRHYDYAGSSLYFVTLCTHNRECIFGEIVDGEMRLNVAGQLATDEWLRSAEMRSETITLDEFVIMPNHLHAIVAIASTEPVQSANRAQSEQPTQRAHAVRPYNMTRPPRSLGSLLAGYKATVTRQLRAVLNEPEMIVWQRNYYEHIVRNDDLDRIHRYIRDNPIAWATDRENPDRSPVS